MRYLPNLISSYFLTFMRRAWWSRVKSAKHILYKESQAQIFSANYLSLTYEEIKDK